MCVNKFSVSLDASYAKGDPITGEELAKALAADVSNMTVAGGGQEAQPARIIGATLSRKDYKERETVDEPGYVSYDSFVDEACIQFAKWLATLAPRGFDRLRAKGAEIKLVLTCAMDQNQLDLNFTPELMAEADRLGVPLKIVAAGKRPRSA